MMYFIWIHPDNFCTLQNRKQEYDNNLMTIILKIEMVEDKASLRNVGDFGANELVRV